MQDRLTNLNAAVLLSSRGAAFPFVDDFFCDHQPSPTQASGEVSTARRRGWSLGALS